MANSNNSALGTDDLPDIWSFPFDEMEFTDMEYLDFHVGHLAQFAVYASLAEPFTHTARASGSTDALTGRTDGEGGWTRHAGSTGYTIGGPVVALPAGDFFQQDDCECWSLMPNCIIDCGILMMARLYQPGQRRFRPDHGRPDPRGLLRPGIGDFVSGRAHLDIHIPELQEAPPCVYTWQITRIQGRDDETLDSTMASTEVERIWARLVDSAATTARNDCSLVLLATPATPVRVKTISEAAGVSYATAANLLSTAPVALRSRLTRKEARDLSRGLREAGINVAFSYVPRLSSGKDAEFDANRPWTHLEAVAGPNETSPDG